MPSIQQITSGPWSIICDLSDDYHPSLPWFKSRKELSAERDPQTCSKNLSKRQIHSGKLIRQWKNNHLKMYLLLKMVIVYCHVSFGRQGKALFWSPRVTAIFKLHDLCAGLGGIDFCGFKPFDRYKCVQNGYTVYSTDNLKPSLLDLASIHHSLL